MKMNYSMTRQQSRFKLSQAAVARTARTEAAASGYGQQQQQQHNYLHKD